MSDVYKVRYREGKRFCHGFGVLNPRIISDDGGMWISLRDRYTNEAALLPAWQVEYEGKGPRGGRKWLPVTEFLDSWSSPDEGPSSEGEAVQLGLFSKEAA